jgi:signal transduction histidine kinase
MKYWQKIFLSTLVLFLAALNMGAYLLFAAAFKTSLNSERDRSFSEHGFICSAMGDDIASILSREETPDKAIWQSLFSRYAEYYYSQGIFIAINGDDDRTYSNLPDITVVPNMPGDGSKASVIADVSGTPYLFVSGRIGDSGFGLVTARSVAGMQASADDLSSMLTFGSALMSVVLAAALYVILKRLTMPIKKLSDAATAIAGGDYSIRAKILGHDEIAEFASRFFEMAQTIEAQITELKLESERKQRFIDDLAHEMRTPLASISGYTQYLSEAVMSDEERLSAYAYISRESARLADLSEKLLMLAKLRLASPVKECVSMKTLFADAAKTLPAHEALVRFDAGTAIWQSDGTLLYMLLINLVINAVHACRQGDEISVTADDKKIVVADNGCGMSHESLTHITEPFYRVDKSRSRQGGGAGLGLSICESICNCLGYEMQIESEQGKGTTVTVLQLDNDLDINC